MQAVNQPPAGMVMIPDENGVQQPWTIIPRPEIIPKNPNIRALMELGSDSDKEDNDEAAMAKKAIYWGIWSGIKVAMNSTVAGASVGKLLWKQVPTTQRNDVRAEVLENNPYLRRFEGGWIEELIMMTQLSNSRDTYRRKMKKATKAQLKPLNRLSKQTKKQSLKSHKDKASSSTHQSNKASNNVSNSGERSNNTAQPTATSNKKRSVANNEDREMEDTGESSGSDDGAWSQGVDTEIAASKSKQSKDAPSTSSSAAKKGKQPEVPPASTSGRRPRPVPRRAPSSDGDEDEDSTTRLFRRTTRAGKQETIDEAETEVTEKGNKSKGKTPMKNKKNTGGKKKAGK
ncbi:unnamed protein product [Rhizoctonia solani]|uniref:Uncharacterized protein n=1 Tax=Rhizoctonia solani TaxID=456999 RepID=A0A8H3CPB5_9AGAM|nr:unnamed protein product [Rhizoctonia solani]